MVKLYLESNYNTLFAGLRSSTPLKPEPNIGEISDPFSATCHPYKIFPSDPLKCIFFRTNTRLS
jgi:hypothetical protein